MVSTPAFALRPLGIGEIFDRAVTLYVRNFVTFTLMVLTLLAPLAVVQYVLLPDRGESLAQVIGQIEHPVKTPRAPVSNEEIVALMVIFAIAVVFAPFVNNAVAVGVAHVYNGGEPQYGASFAAVFRRWLPLLGTAILNVSILLGLYMLMVVGLILLLTVGILLVRPALPLAVVVFAFAIVALLAVLLLFLLLLIAYAFSMYSTSLEDASPVHAIGLAYRRIFNRVEFKKALLMAVAYIGLQIGVFLLSTTVALLATFVVKNYAVELAVNTVVSAMMGAFLTILLAVYYYDVRTRIEGLDLETDLQRLTAAS
ncbi:MAG: hypothetical protein JO322_16560 [Candidatus Eremiobacteraeota bacterium]|nr:hypothetical protein [Candidatus Eremiobacteraeota bacterium]